MEPEVMLGRVQLILEKAKELLSKTGDVPPTAIMWDKVGNAQFVSLTPAGMSWNEPRVREEAFRAFRHLVKEEQPDSLAVVMDTWIRIAVGMTEQEAQVKMKVLPRKEAIVLMFETEREQIGLYQLYRREGAEIIYEGEVIPLPAGMMGRATSFLCVDPMEPSLN